MYLSEELQTKWAGVLDHPDMDKITEALSPLSLKKKYFVEKKSNQGTVLELINTNDILKVGDKIVVRIELKSDRTMEYLHLKDMRASATEPVNILSNYNWRYPIFHSNNSCTHTCITTSISYCKIFGCCKVSNT